MKHIIDINTWERKENYEFFLGFENQERIRNSLSLLK